MATGIEHLLAEGIISEVLGRLRSGKEADVYVVRYGQKVVAAKVYKNREHRSFKNNAAYKEGRSVRNSRSQRAIEKGSRFGKDSAEDAWKLAEVDALYKLHGAGVRVPAPVMYLDGVLLMELVSGEDGEAAPRLIDTDMTVAEATAGYHDMLRQLVGILCCELIHGDLSPYNVLRAVQGNTIIDFPQIISASHNSNSETFFLRDARNILGYFANIDRSLEARRGDPAEIWRAYVKRELSPDFLPTGRSAPPAPRPRPALESAPRPQRSGPRKDLPRPEMQSAAPGAGPSAPGPRGPQRSSGQGRHRGPPPAPNGRANGGRSAPRMPEIIVMPNRAAPRPAAPQAAADSARPAAVSDPAKTGRRRRRRR
jgi:RIO kinase 1